MKQYEMFELAFSGKEPVGSQATVNLHAEFSCGEETRRVAGFYAGNGIYKVRFYPEKAGLYRWSVTGEVREQGEVLCGAAEAPDGCKEEAFGQGQKEIAAKGCHGMVRADGCHFRYDDGARYQPFGTTIYALVHQRKDLIDTTMRTLSEAPFNKVRFCVFPKHYDFNHNEPDYFAFEKTDLRFDVNRPCFAFWDALEERIKELAAMGIEGDLILFHPYDRWGFSKLTKEECLIYLDYLTRRLSAFPNLWWSLANEFDLMGDFQEEWWPEFAAFIARHDPYGHLLSNHNCLKYWDFANEHTTHCCIQDTCVDQAAELRQQFGKPVVFDECCYEGNIIHPWGNISAFEMVNRFWTAMVCGGYCTHGETYMDENDILWWAAGGVLHGESPKRIAFLREIAEGLPGPLDFLEKETGLFSMERIRALRENGIPDGENNPFIKGILSMPKERAAEFVSRHKELTGHCGEEAYLRYFRCQCTCLCELTLPESGSYRIEVIDVWEMTRTEAAKGINGKVTVKLPGKEGIAVMAVRE